jgi:hypothetical protein
MLKYRLIGYLASVLEQAIQYVTCFISHSTEDQDFANPDYAPPAVFLHARPSRLLHAHAVDPSGLDRCASTRCATHWGLICRDRRRIGAHGPAAQGPDCIRPSATVRNSAPSGQLVGS